MALYPGATQRLIRPGANDPAIIVIGAILHVDAGNSASLYNYFNGPSGGIESHFHFPKVGRPEQYRDTGYEADANLKANSFIKDGKRYGYLSAETQGLERGEWNDHQLDELKKWLLWASKTHNFPLQKCPAHTKPGVGYHVMFGAPGPWTPVSKSCPGPDRVKQFNNVLVPWFANAAKPPMTVPPLTTPTKETTMATLDEVLDSVQALDVKETNRYAVATGRYEEMNGRLKRLEDAVGRVDGELADGGDTDRQLDRIEDDTDDGVVVGP